MMAKTAIRLRSTHDCRRGTAGGRRNAPRRRHIRGGHRRRPRTAVAVRQRAPPGRCGPRLWTGSGGLTHVTTHPGVSVSYRPGSPAAPPWSRAAARPTGSVSSPPDRPRGRAAPGPGRARRSRRSPTARPGRRAGQGRLPGGRRGWRQVSATVPDGRPPCGPRSSAPGRRTARRRQQDRRTGRDPVGERLRRGARYVGGTNLLLGGHAKACANRSAIPGPSAPGCALIQGPFARQASAPCMVRNATRQASRFPSHSDGWCGRPADEAAAGDSRPLRPRGRRAREDRRQENRP